MKLVLSLGEPAKIVDSSSSKRESTPAEEDAAPRKRTAYDMSLLVRNFDEAVQRGCIVDAQKAQRAIVLEMERVLQSLQ